MSDINNQLVKMFGIPSDAIAATLRMRINAPPVLTVTRLVFRTGEFDEPSMKHDKYRLVPVEDVGETPSASHHDAGVNHYE